jgi:hypothetical protein
MKVAYVWNYSFSLGSYEVLQGVYEWFTYTSQIYLRSQLRIYWCYFYSLCSQHVSVPTGHPQVKYNYITYIF